MMIIQSHSPTIDAEKEEADGFYGQVQSKVDRICLWLDTRMPKLQILRRFGYIVWIVWPRNQE